MTDTPVPDVREIAARVIHRQEHWSMPLVHRTMNPDGVCEGALHIADAVLAAVEPVIRQQVAEEIAEKIDEKIDEMVHRVARDAVIATALDRAATIARLTAKEAQTNG